MSHQALPAKRRAMFVENFVTHPGGMGAGSALIEAAATLAQQRGYGGDLFLEPLRGSRSAYEALGFVPDGTMMRLAPSSPENMARWKLHDGEWKLTKYLTKPLVSNKSEMQSPPVRE
jgi:hypothetical protein